MSQFDPYHKWLAIPAKDQPANYYRLLGLQLFECDPDVIESLSNLRINFVQQLKKPPHQNLAQGILEELHQARSCLLSPSKKAAYDESLRAEIASKQVEVRSSPRKPIADPDPTLPKPDESHVPVDSERGPMSEEAPIEVLQVSKKIIRREAFERALSSIRHTLTRHWKPIVTGGAASLVLGILLWNLPSLLIFGRTSSNRNVGASLEDKSLVPGQERHDNYFRMPLCWCPEGTFQMGSPVNELNRDDDEKQARVTFQTAFWIGQREVTQPEWRSIMITEPWLQDTSSKVGRNYPATNMSWNEAHLFCQKLTKWERDAGRIPQDWVYRLPTEAEWEYACRAATQTPFYFGTDESKLSEFAWFRANSVDDQDNNHLILSPVMKKNANPWNLYDMHGNVREWCLDFYVDSLPGGQHPVVMSEDPKRVNRGGSFREDPKKCRSAYRQSDRRNTGSPDLGFRIVLAPVSPVDPKQPLCWLAYLDAIQKAELELLKAISDRIDRVRNESEELTRSQTREIEELEAERFSFQNYGSIPFSSRLRTAALTYLKSRQDAVDLATEELEKLLKQSVPAVNTEIATATKTQLETLKQQVQTPQLVGTWTCHGINFRGNFTWSLYSDYSMSGTNNSWYMSETELVLTNRSGANSGGFIDRCNVADSGQSFVARNQFGGRYNGVRKDR